MGRVPILSLAAGVILPCYGPRKSVKRNYNLFVTIETNLKYPKKLLVPQRRPKITPRVSFVRFTIPRKAALRIDCIK